MSIETHPFFVIRWIVELLFVRFVKS